MVEPASFFSMSDMVGPRAGGWFGWGEGGGYPFKGGEELATGGSDGRRRGETEGGSREGARTTGAKS